MNYIHRILILIIGISILACKPIDVTNKARYTVEQQYYKVEKENRTSESQPEVSYAPLNTVYFEYNEFYLSMDAKEILQRFYSEIQLNTHQVYFVDGNTDSSGSNDYNFELSSKRAKSVIDYLIHLGANRNQFVILANGELKPIADNTISPELNRRVTIYKKEN